jgi:hypothetical protein
MQREHIRAEQYADTGCAKVVDAFGQSGMLGLGGVQVWQDHNSQALPNRLTEQPKRQGVGDPAAHLLRVLNVAGATTIASGSGSTSGSPGSL